MSDRKLQVQVGVLFILSLVVLIWGILWFKEFTIGGTTNLVQAEFPSTSGLLKGDPVEVKGVPSGKVAAIRFTDGRAIVELHINQDVVLHEGAEAAIENVGLMGQKVVAVHPGPNSAPPLRGGTVLNGTYSSGIPEIMGDLGATLATFERLAVRVDSLLMGFDHSKQEQLHRTMGNMERVTDELATLLTDNRDELSGSIHNMNAAMADLHAMVDGRDEQFGRLMDDASGAAARLDTTLITLEQTVLRIDGMLTRVDSGEGTLGKVMQDEALYDELVVTLRDAKALLRDLRENPRKYFKVSVF